VPTLINIVWSQLAPGNSEIPGNNRMRRFLSVFLLQHCIQLRNAPEGSEHQVENNVTCLSQIVRLNLEFVDDSQLMVEMENEMKAIWDRYPGNPFYPLHIATGILWLLLCRFLLVVLEAQSYSLGLRTPDGLAAVTNLGQIIARVENIAMCWQSDLSDSSAAPRIS
jgi:hypothetical protein